MDEIVLRNLHLVAAVAAFWVAILGYRWMRPDGSGGTRFVLGLGLGAVLCHLGWALLHADRVWDHPWALLDAGAGFSVLFVPFGLLLAVPWRAPRRERQAFLAASFGCLPLALATARLGCVFAGCCHGVPTELPWGIALEAGGHPLHPTALYDIAGLLALHALTRRVGPAWIVATVLVGVGLLRLAIQPLRAAPLLGPTAVPIEWIAAACVAAGWLLAPRRWPTRQEIARTGSFFALGAREG